MTAGNALVIEAMQENIAKLATRRNLCDWIGDDLVEALDDIPMAEVDTAPEVHRGEDIREMIEG